MKWISVKDRLPGNNIESVLVYRNGSIAMASVDWYFNRNDHRNVDITHWMPLPSAPEESE